MHRTVAGDDSVRHQGCWRARGPVRRAGGTPVRRGFGAIAPWHTRRFDRDLQAAARVGRHSTTRQGTTGPAAKPSGRTEGASVRSALSFASTNRTVFAR
jgi:hypothetical protein